MAMFNVLGARALSRFALLALLLAGGLAIGAGGRHALAHAGHGMPARIQEGTCETIGPVAFELTGVGATEDSEGNEIPEPEIMGAPTASEVQASVTTVPAALDAIISGGHAIAVYLSDDAMDVTVACGDVGGIVVGEDLVVGLAPEGDDGRSGIALLRAEDEETVVSVFLTAAAHDEGDDHDEEDGHDHDEEDEATPAA